MRRGSLIPSCPGPMELGVPPVRVAAGGPPPRVWTGMRLPLLCVILLSGGTAAQEKSPWAGTVVRSKEYVVRREPRRQEEFIGEVYYNQLNRTATSDWALYDHEDKIWKARGRVHAEMRAEDGEFFLADGHEARHDLKTRLGDLRGKEEPGAAPAAGLSAAGTTRAENDMRVVRIERRAAGGGEPDILTARKLRWKEGAREAELDGDVRLEGAQAESRAHRALYRHEGRSLALSGGRPVCRVKSAQAAAEAKPAWQGAIQADALDAGLKSRSLNASGSVRGWVEFQRGRDKIK